MSHGSHDLLKNLKDNLIPERVGSAISRELFKNGATAKNSFPKRIYNGGVR
jgi:hypothetical protein